MSQTLHCASPVVAVRTASNVETEYTASEALMRMNNAALSAAFAVVVAARPGGAQISPWTEARAVARAMARAPAVQSSMLALMSAEAIGTFGRVPIIGNPTINVRGLIGAPDRLAAVYSVLVGIPFDVSGVQSAWRREARWASREALANMLAARNEAAAAAREALSDLAVADAMVLQSRARVEAARELLARTQARLQARAATALDVSLSERELGQALADLASSRRERQDAGARFRATLDLPPTGTLVVAPVDVPRLPPGRTREALIARALARRPEPASFAAAANRFRASSRRLFAQSVSPLFVAGEYEHQSYQQGSFGMSMQWSVPWLRTAQGERAVAMADATRASSLRALTERQIAREVGAAYDALVLRAEEVQAIRGVAIPALERTLQQTEHLFEAGAVDYFRVLLARQELAAARLRGLDALRGAWRARVALDRAVGEPITD